MIGRECGDNLGALIRAKIPAGPLPKEDPITFWPADDLASGAREPDDLSTA